MEDANISVEEQQLCCPICLDLLTDPVTIPCGHSYCKTCLRHYWDQKAGDGGCCCPQCRRSFRVRPELNRNTVLAELVEKCRGRRSSSRRPTTFSGSEGVLCDVCSGDEKHAAVSSCLVCLVSYCQAHVEPHFRAPAFQKHKLVPACGRLQDKICPAHDRLYEFYCRAEQECVCYLCTMGEHEKHCTVPVASARAEKEEELLNQNRVMNQMIQRKEKECEDLKKAIHNIKCSAKSACDEIERMFTELLVSIEKKHVEVMDMLRTQQETERRTAEGALEQVELEIADLRRRNAELEKTLQTSDHIDFLQKYLSFTCSSWTEAFASPPPNLNVTFEKVTHSVSKLQKSLENICSAEMSNISEKIEEVCIFQCEKPRRKAPKPEAPLNPMPEPKTREDFLHYSCYLTLKPRPDHPNLKVCEDDRAVVWVACDSSVSKWPQVQCREALTGRCYWEVEWQGSGICTVGLCQGPKRRGLSQAMGFGRDAQSWGLDCFQMTFMFRHNNRNISIPAPKSTTRVGVYLDHRAGTLSFYSVSSAMTLLYRARANFTQALYPGFALWSNGWQIGRSASYFFNDGHLTSEKVDMCLRLVNL
ncbi:E3 ubiquitin/ISG15 ligase TRIM25-like [Salminus brasiliensis]|uniref:E3 ubiquitin/ISG15 ligase TRIM25-like n=1 Tax=Salminus brasiliensis TaxID=930266 RepID=UPI003B834E2C